MTAKSIYPPSALRLLCLVNGVRCEICTQNPVNHVRKGYAIFVCWNCTICRDKTTVITGADLMRCPISNRLLSNGMLVSSPSGWQDSGVPLTQCIGHIEFLREKHIQFRVTSEIRDKGVEITQL